MPLSKRAADIKYFIHDLRIDRFYKHLIQVHRILLRFYAEAGKTGDHDRHVRYIDRLQGARDRAHEARTRYEIAVREQAAEEEILSTGRAYIEATLRTCRICLLPHWRNFEVFLNPLPKDTAARKYESEFHETKNWIQAIHQRIQNFLAHSEEEPPMEAIALDRLLKRYVDSTLRSYVRAASNNRLFIRLGQVSPCHIFAEPMRLRRLIFNLVMNAVDAMREHEGGHIRISSECDDLTVKIKVTDAGQGMDTEKINKILHSEEDLRGELHSLGFRFVRETVESFNGKITVESEVGVGTTVALLFPRHTFAFEEVERPMGRMAALEEHLVDPKAESEEARAGAIIVDDFCRSLAPLPGCLFSICITSDGEVDHFAHKPYDPDWLMGHEDLAPMLYRAVFRGRYETDDRAGTALVLKSPHGYEDYWELRETPEHDRTADQVRRMIHNEYVRIGRHLVESGMDAQTMVYITNSDKYFAPFDQAFERDPFPLAELAGREIA